MIENLIGFYGVLAVKFLLVGLAACVVGFGLCSLGVYLWEKWISWKCGKGEK